MKIFLILLLAGFFSLSCTDDMQRELSPNSMSAEINSQAWTSADVYTQRSLNEEGPLTIVGTGEGYVIEIILGNINEVGEYAMGTNRIGNIKLGNTTYSTLDVQNAGKIVISSFSNNRVSGYFFFEAQWLSANNTMQVAEGHFDASYY